MRPDDIPYTSVRDSQDIWPYSQALGHGYSLTTTPSAPGAVIGGTFKVSPSKLSSEEVEDILDAELNIAVREMREDNLLDCATPHILVIVEKLKEAIAFAAKRVNE